MPPGLLMPGAGRMRPSRTPAHATVQSEILRQPSANGSATAPDLHYAFLL